MQIFNTTTKESQIIDDDAKIPKGWTDQKPLWVLCETFNGHEWVEDLPASAQAKLSARQELRNRL